MANKIIVLGMMISLHSVALIFASLLTYKWLVNENKEVGIFGVCEYYNSSIFKPILIDKLNQNNGRIYLSIDEKNNTSYNDTFKLNSTLNIGKRQIKSIWAFGDNYKISATTTTTTTTTTQTTKTTKIPRNLNIETVNTDSFEIFEFSTRQSEFASTSSNLTTPTIAELNKQLNSSTNLNRTVSSTELNDTQADSYSGLYQKCYQLFWPDSKDALQYLSGWFILYLSHFKIC